MPTISEATGGFVRVDFDQSEVESLLTAEAAKLGGVTSERVQHVFMFNEDAAMPKAWVLLSIGGAAV